MNPVLAAALAYADLGYRVFPCVPGDKLPLTPHGFYNSTTDAEKIRDWWGQFPRANLAIRTDDLLVLDRDGENNRWPSPEQALTLGDAPTSLTPRGGSHSWFRQPTGKGWRSHVGKLADNVDTRADGGYALVPPSLIEGKTYSWVLGLDVAPGQLPFPPAWLEKELDRLELASWPLVGAGGEANPIPDGQRNSTLASLAGSMRRRGMSLGAITAALLAENGARCVPPLDEREVRRIAKSVSRYDPDQLSVALAESHWEQDRAKPSKEPTDPGPLTDDFLNPPGFLGEVIQFTNLTSFRPQPVLALAGALALLAVLTGRKVADAQGTRTNLYVLGVGASGSGKERARVVNKDILRAAGLDEFIGPEGIASHAGLVSAVREQPALLLQLDEIGRLMRAINNPMAASHLVHVVTNLLKLFTSASGVYRGDAYADATRVVTIEQPHACVYGTTVPRSLLEGMTAESITDGLLSRFLIFEAPPEMPPKLRPVVFPPPERLVRMARAWAAFSPGGNLSSLSPTPLVIQFSTEAEAIFDALEAGAETESLRLGEPFGTLWTRAGEKARKLTLLFACGRDGPEAAVDAEAAEWGTALAKHLTARTVWLASRWLSENQFDAARLRLLRLIEAAGAAGITASDLCRASRALKAKDRDEILQALMMCGDVIAQREKTKGAPKMTYFPGDRELSGKEVEKSPAIASETTVA